MPHGIMGKTLTVAIDGPSGAGKSSLARLAAKKLGFIYVDTGALYRSIGLFAHENQLGPGKEKQLIESLREIHVELKYVDGAQKVYLNMRDVTDKIRSPEVSMATSRVSAIPEVRTFLLDLQRNIASENSVIMDGRDIGTVVLPDAQVKIFLTASLEARAQRRYKEYIAKGEKISYNNVLDEMQRRDFNDSSRAVAPLKKAEDAVLLDTSDRSFDESLQMILDTIKECSVE